ncbi:hypothetical protein PAAG_11545 [Paracoccidioides lutzii Pb01]|uniref:Uncharacterized protein n=1 Tax=Paracoccidioides lutzii (strain ATCC MYA-826 / Pb01) TaxID=502779 RepID=A0A0A2VLI5_PARBA|nr:hypothetical protein PAAG_11545 [Paracoccidioides lutzii Pb01]KGQ01699.1 hypothetical protein PAAG_11545 [Paracoccidioides lutzii Pb01]
MDLLLSENGWLGTNARDPLAMHMPIYFSQGDIIFQAKHRLPRITLGLFRIALETMYKSLTGGDLEQVVYGKPELATQIRRRGHEVVDERDPQRVYPSRKHLYMIGDNPVSDIIGGNMYGWNTCLVRTGVFQGEGNDEDSPASFGVFDTVLETVQVAVCEELGLEFKLRWRENEKVISA